MGWNGSGGFTRTHNWVNDKAAAVKITASRMDAEFDNYDTGLENCITRDGQNSPSANLPMATKRHTGVGNAASRTDYASAGQVQDGALVYLGSVAGTDEITADASPPITAYAAGQRFHFVAADTNTGATTIDVNSVGAKAIQKNGAALVAGDITAGDAVELAYDGTQFQMTSPARTPVLTAGGILGASVAAATATTRGSVELATDAETVTGTDTARAATPAGVAAAIAASVPAIQGHVSGLTLSNNGTDASNDIDIAAGQATASDGSALMTLASAITKRLDASWAVGDGNGGLDTGSEATGTWYYVYLIQRSDTGVVDALFTATYGSPTMPTNYDRRRYIGAVYNDGSSVIRPFTQTGDYFMFDDAVEDADTSAVTTSRTSVTCSAPPGRRCGLLARIIGNHASPGNIGIVQHGGETDAAPAAAAVPGASSSFLVSNLPVNLHNGLLITNTSAQIHVRSSASSTTMRVYTFGYIDWIERNAA